MREGPGVGLLETLLWKVLCTGVVDRDAATTGAINRKCSEREVCALYGLGKLMSGAIVSASLS